MTPDACAREANFSRFHFHRVFSGLVGESLNEHIRRMRLESAADVLFRPEVVRVLSLPEDLRGG